VLEHRQDLITKINQISQEHDLLLLDLDRKIRNIILIFGNKNRDYKIQITVKKAHVDLQWIIEQTKNKLNKLITEIISKNSRKVCE
jgi:MinD-like ATPase involved in chromosome partitioning or flagellar assembly